MARVMHSTETEVAMTSFTLISTLLAPIFLVALYWWYGRRQKPVAASTPARAFAPVGVPLGVFLHPGHSWAGLNISGEMRLGIDELLTQALGGVDRVDLPEVGTRAERGRPLVTLWRHGRELPVLSPVSGTVVGVNRGLERSSMAVENDPYGTGWMAAVLPSDQREAVSDLRVGVDAVRWLKRETQRFVDFVARQATPGLVGVVLADGAHPVVGAVDSLDDDGWRHFEREFVDRTES